jgi:hypothetical protein
VVFGGRRAKTWLILGEGLVGMEFLEEAFSDLRVDFENQLVNLRLRRRRRG